MSGEIPINHFTFDGISMIQIQVRTAQRVLAADWPKETCWTGSMRVTQLGEKCYIYFENDGKMFAQSDISVPNSVTPAVDSSRYFMVVLHDPNSGRRVPMGIMFPKTARKECFNFKVALSTWNTGDINEEVPELHRKIEDLSLGSEEKFTVEISSFGRSNKLSTGENILAAPQKHKKDKKKKDKKHKKSKSKTAEADPFGDFGDAFGADPFGQAAPIPSSGQDPFAAPPSDPFADFNSAFAAPSQPVQQQQQPQQQSNPFAAWGG